MCLQVADVKGGRNLPLNPEQQVSMLGPLSSHYVDNVDACWGLNWVHLEAAASQSVAVAPAGSSLWAAGGQPLAWVPAIHAVLRVLEAPIKMHL